MSADPPKKSSSVLEKLGQKFSTIKDDIADNLERRKQSYNLVNNNQVHFITRTNTSDDSLVIEKKPPTPPEIRRQVTTEENSLGERTISVTQLATSLNKKTIPSVSCQDLFTCENSEQAKEMLINDVRQQSDETKSLNSEHSPRTKRKATSLLAGPRFRSQTLESNGDMKRDLIYPVSGAVGLVSLILTLCKPISSFLSGFLVGFLFAASLAYLLMRLYLNARTDEQQLHEWIDFSDLETMLKEKVSKQDKRTTLHSCGEIIFGRYDADRDEEFVRYPVVIRLDNYRLIIQLPTKIKSDDRKEKEMKFIGYREYLIKEANMILVPEPTLTRIKYWLNEYPIILQNLQLLDKQIVNKQSLEKSKFDTDDFFNNPQTTLSLFFETGPDKEQWFHKLSLVLRKGKEEIERVNRLLLNSTSVEQGLNIRTPSVQSNLVHLEDRVQIKHVESVETISSIDSAEISTDTRSTSNTPGRTRLDSFKKLRKQDENLQRVLDSPDCLDETALTLNFLTRRLFCDVFEETLFRDFLKEKIELKLKEIALTVLEDLHVETIEMGNTFPIILKVEPMQWNSRGIWFNLFILYRGSFKTTIKTRIILKRLLTSSNPTDQPLYAQQHPAQLVHREEENIDEDDIVQRQKILAEKPEVAESVASRKLGTLLTKVASNKTFQRIAALKPFADVMEKLSNSDVGVNIELLNISGMMTINIPPPPSDRIWIGFSEMPDLNLKVTPVFGESKYSYALIHDFLEARIREEIRRLLVLPAMDDQLLAFMRDWVVDVIGAIATKKTSNSDEQHDVY